jgi:DNA polymerase I
MQIQVLDVNYITRNNDPVVQLFGILPDGKSCIKQVVGHKPYFYIEIDNSKEKSVIEFIKSKSYIIEIVNRFRPVGFQTKAMKMFKITTHQPKQIRDLRIELESLDGVKAMYEGDILYKNRVLIDNDIGGMSWVDVKEGDCITWEEVRSIDAKKPALLKCISIDIETLPPDVKDLTHIAPTSDKDPVIMISLAFDPPYEGNRDLVLIGKQLNCPRPDIQSFRTESDMLYKLLDIIKEYDPSILVGFNILGYDFPYLNERMLQYGIKPSFGRDNSSWYIKDVLGGKNVSIAGRVIIDLLPIIRRDQDPKMKLPQYNLKTVVHELIKMEKYDEPVKEMRGHWFSSGIEFNRFVSYARHDAVLVMFLLNQLKFLERLTALSRASGALLQDVANGGQSNMIEALLLRRFKADNRVLNIKPAYGKENSTEDSELKGATVLDIEKGLLENLLILDFKSLYPTLMIANNLCYTTVVVDEVPEKFGVSPLGAKFASPDIKKGIVPQILTELLDERISIKKQMKTMSDGQDKDVLDARQYAIKILLNSFYGYSGYKRARLYSLDVAGAVTSNGRANLLRTKDIIEKEIGSIDGKELIIVYGDTDSVFVKVGKNTGELMDPDDAEKIGSMIAKVVTKDLPEPMELVFEAFSKRSLFLAKKRYALWRFEKGKDGWKDKMKYSGIEVKRRDFCPLIANTLSACLDLILKQGDINAAKKLSMETINRVRDLSPTDSQLFDQLVLTRKYGKVAGEYKNKQPHMVLLEKMRLRGEELPGIGDRIPFIVIKGKTKRDRAREKFVERAETPARVKELKIPIDIDYYIERQLLPPLTRMLQPFGITSKELDMHNQSTLLAFL